MSRRMTATATAVATMHPGTLTTRPRRIVDPWTAGGEAGDVVGIG